MKTTSNLGSAGVSRLTGGNESTLFTCIRQAICLALSVSAA